MKRTQIQLDDATYEGLRRKAFEEGRSMSAVVRETLAKSFGTSAPATGRVLGDFAFVGAGRARAGRARPTSETHDTALADAVAQRFRR